MRAPHERNGLLVCCEHEEEYVFCKIDAKALKKLNDTHTLNKNATQKQPNTKKTMTTHSHLLIHTYTHYRQGITKLCFSVFQFCMLLHSKNLCLPTIP